MSSVLTLVHDGALCMEVAPSASPHVDAWLPFSARHTSIVTNEPSRVAMVTVRPAETVTPNLSVAGDNVTAHEGGRLNVLETASPTLRLGGVDAYLNDSAQAVTLRSASGDVTGYVDLATNAAWIDVVTTTPPRRDSDVSSALTLCVALLLNRLDRALVHAAAIAPPGEEGSVAAWLLIGDTHSGKTTTTVNLMSAGWDYLSDDHVVLSSTYPGPTVEGWPRTFHLDAGWGTAAPKHQRMDADPRTLAPARWRSDAILGGILFPTVVAHEETRLEPMTAADALSGLVRQSPWLMADRHAAPSVLALLTAAARLPAYRLVLGLDTFNDSTLLAQRLAPLGRTALLDHAANVPDVLHG